MKLWNDLLVMAGLRKRKLPEAQTPPWAGLKSVKFEHGWDDELRASGKTDHEIEEIKRDILEQIHMNPEEFFRNSEPLSDGQAFNATVPRRDGE